MSDVLTVEKLRAAVEKLKALSVPPDQYGNYWMPVHPWYLSYMVYRDFGFSGFKARRKSSRLRMMAGFPKWYRP